MLCVYVYDRAADEVAVVTIQDSRSSRAATAQELPINARANADDVAAAGRHEATIDTYFRHAMFFVRWLAGDFEPRGRGAASRDAGSCRCQSSWSNGHNYYYRK
jgi:hypothetical protein